MTNNGNAKLSHGLSSLTRCRVAATGSAAIVLEVVASGLSALAPHADLDSIPADAGFTSWADNGRGGGVVLKIVKGEAPAPGLKVAGVITTDTNCAPDESGLSHCRNAIA